MANYPDLPISADGYFPEWSDGTEVARAENGRPWLYRPYDQEQLTLTITHPALDKDQEAMLREFYRDHKSDELRFRDPRTEEWYMVYMQGPPRVVGIRGARYADIEMVLLGVRE